ncbi:Putative disease resistance protein RGA3 [Linum perenne]
MTKGIGGLKSLQTLPVFVVSKSRETVWAGLDELRELNALRGQLIIRNLVEAKSLGAGVYVLNGMLFLQSLILDWGSVDDSDDYDDDAMSNHDEDILKMLCPHHTLKKLNIGGGYVGVKLPSWLSTLVYLVEFSLKDCKKCEYLPPLHNFPCLKKLTISACPQLKGINNSEGSGSQKDWPSFHCLAYLLIYNCPKLTRLPAFPTVEGDLTLGGTSLEPLRRTMNMWSRAPALTTPLSKVGILELWEIADLESLPEEGHRNLTSLYGLVIVSCPRLTSLPPAMRHLTSLQTLIIRDCPQLTERCRKGDGEDWSNISHVQTIFLNGRKYCN